MPVEVTRPATAYRLWDNDDRAELFGSHAAVGWVCQLQAMLVDTSVTWAVLLQNNAAKQVKSAQLTQVMVSDLMNVEVLDVADYNALYPDAPVTEGS